MTELIAIACYALAWVGLLDSTLKRANIYRFAGIAVIVGTAFHAAFIYPLIFTPAGIEDGLFQIGPVFFLCMNVIVLVGSKLRLLIRLLLFLLPLEILSIVLAVLVNTNTTLQTGLSPALVAHIASSILAYSLFTIATLLAILLNYQLSKLKSKQIKPLTGIFPPLQTMEILLFNLLWSGFILLSFALVTGFAFIEDIFAQHLAHKTVFSCVSWVVYAILLFGRHQLGWRGKTAVRWAISGFALLMTGYFGTKFVLEFIV